MARIASVQYPGSAEHRPGERARGFALHARHDVCVGVEHGGRRVVAEALGNDSWIQVGLEMRSSLGGSGVGCGA